VTIAQTGGQPIGATAQQYLVPGTHNAIICKQSRLSQSNLFLSEIIIFLLSYFHILIIIKKNQKSGF
jgi:hypothetical protein